MAQNYTLHIRLLKSCNAVCDYCSAFEIKHDPLMNQDQLEISLNFIKNFWNTSGIQINHLSVEYVGGEILLIPSPKIKSIVELIEKTLSPLCQKYTHGCQSNLIGSKEKLDALDEIFAGNVGTSVDHHTGQRKVGGSVEKYQKIFLMRQKEYQRKHFQSPGAVWVLDKKSQPFLKNEIDQAHKKNYSLVIRPLFEGGLPIHQLPINQIEDSYVEAFDLWFLQKKIILQPFYQMLKRRLSVYWSDDNFEQENAGCHFQHDCAVKSLNLEPNGDLYICQEMADGKHLLLGNALNNHFNWDTWNKIKARSDHLKNECYQCDFYKSCQGGCMNEALESTQEVYGKTHLCSVWKKTFSRIDNVIQQNEPERIKNWLKIIEHNQK